MSWASMPWMICNAKTKSHGKSALMDNEDPLADIPAGTGRVGLMRKTNLSRAALPRPLPQHEELPDAGLVQWHVVAAEGVWEGDPSQCVPLPWNPIDVLLGTEGKAKSPPMPTPCNSRRS